MCIRDSGYTGRSSAENILYDGLTLHPNYFTIIGWANQQARDFIELEPDLFAEGLNRMGYRLVPFQIQYPRSVGRKGDFIVKSLSLIHIFISGEKDLKWMLPKDAGLYLSAYDLDNAVNRAYSGGEFYACLLYTSRCV